MRFMNTVFSLGFVFIAAAIGLTVYIKTGQNFNSLLLAIYAFGFLALAGLFAVFPGGTTAKNEWGDKVRVGNLNNISILQALILLVWFIGFGAYLTYRINFAGNL